ncbi:YggT family protein [Demequina pelophila]|uniref:YggT family protein n=1 Tax=Demequina pelophila TaxID=1638984 RepID=UPI0009E52554|nr:YggT family protein [Demequina pelophila]
MGILIQAAQLLLFLFMLLLLARIVISLVMVFARDWRPTGPSVVAVEGVLTVTDPPIKAVRKVVPPLAIGQVRIDLAFLIVFFTVQIAYQLLLGVG